MRASDHSAASLLVIWRSGLDTQDGCSVQLKRLLDVQGWSLQQVTWQPYPPVHPILAPYQKLNISLVPPVALPVGGRVARKIWTRVALPIACRMLRFRLGRGSPPPTGAYVVVYRDDQAFLALQALRALGIKRYIVHVMDLFTDGSATAFQRGPFAELVRGAAAVLTVSSRIKNELVNLGSDDVEVLPLAAGHEPADIPTPRQPILVMGGAIYSTDADQIGFLETVMLPAWKAALHAVNPPPKWLYFGYAYEMLPASVKPFVENLGIVPDEELAGLLSRSRVAVLPVEHRADSAWRYSFPSRLTDYLSAGLPTLTGPTGATATGDFIREHEGHALFVLDNAEAAKATLVRLFLDDEMWSLHSQHALGIARSFSPTSVRQRVKDLIDRHLLHSQPGFRR